MFFIMVDSEPTASGFDMRKIACRQLLAHSCSPGNLIATQLLAIQFNTIDINSVPTIFLELQIPESFQKTKDNLLWLS